MYWSPRTAAHLRGPLGVAQKAVGGRSGRFPARTDALSGPEQPENVLGSFHFLPKKQDFACFGTPTVTWDPHPRLPADGVLLVTTGGPDLVRCPDASAGASGSLICSRYIAYNI